MVIGICVHVFVLFNDTATTEIYTYGHTLALHDALPISARIRAGVHPAPHRQCAGGDGRHHRAHGCADDPVLHRSEEHTSELQSLMRISYAVFCLKKKPKSGKTICDSSTH